MHKKLPRKCKCLNPPFTKAVLTIIDPKLEPPSTTLVTVSGDKLSSKVMHLPNPLLRNKRLPLKKRPRSQRPPLSSTLSGRTPSNKSDGLNKEPPTQRTSPIKLLFTRDGKPAKPLLTNGVTMRTRVPGT